MFNYWSRLARVNDIEGTISAVVLEIAQLEPKDQISKSPMSNSS